MRPAKITSDMIISAAGQLIALGIRPTIRKVRSIVGSGSFETIARLMNEARDQGQIPTPHSPARPSKQNPLAYMPTPERLEELLEREKSLQRWQDLATERQISLERAEGFIRELSAEVGVLKEKLAVNEAKNRLLIRRRTSR